MPTVDTVRNSELVGTLLLNEANVLCVGPTGTGKTVTVMSKLSRNMPKQFICDFLTFSARTSANQTQVSRNTLNCNYCELNACSSYLTDLCCLNCVPYNTKVKNELKFYFSLFSWC